MGVLRGQRGRVSAEAEHTCCQMGRCTKNEPQGISGERHNKARHAMHSESMNAMKQTNGSALQTCHTSVLSFWALTHSRLLSFLMGSARSCCLCVRGIHGSLGRHLSIVR